MISTQTGGALAALVLLCGSLVACSDGSNDEESPAPDASSVLEERLRRIVDTGIEDGLPGVAVHVRLGDETLEIVSGVADRESGEPLTQTTPLLTSSSGKPFVAALALRLVESGLLRLSDTLPALLDPALGATLPAAGAITLEMLLSHTSGLPNYSAQDAFLSDYADRPGETWTAEEVLGYLDGVDAMFAPGERFGYSNTNFVLAGLVIERATGLSLGEALRQWILEPAALEQTYHPAERPGQPELARGYIDTGEPGEAYFDVTNWVRNDGLGDGPLHSTAHDLDRFIRTLVSSETLLSGAMRERMLSEIEPGSGYGLGIVVAHDASGELISAEHDGVWLGYHARVSYEPTADLSYAVMINASEGRHERPIDVLLRRLEAELAIASDG